MRGSRRSRHEIIMAILEVVVDGANITKIVYKANINFKMAKNYLNYLIEKELIEVLSVNGRDVYKITEKGKSMLMRFRDFATL